MISQTSIEAFIEVYPKIGERQTQVLRTLYLLDEATNRMISENCKLPINCITGRVTELFRKGCVYVSKVDSCLAALQRDHVERNAKYWKLTEKGYNVLKFKGKEE